VPDTDDGQFVMSANGTTGPAAGDGATASVTVAVGSSVNFSEVADSGTSLADYMTTFSCNDLANTTGAGTSGSLIMPNADVTCTFTNVRTRTLTVVKGLVPSSDDGQFVMSANGATGPAAGDGATASVTVAVGSSVNFSEVADSGTSLADYTTTFSCNDPANTTGAGTSGSLIMPNADVTCTFTNVRTRTLTVVKSLVPSSDDGQYVMSANGTKGTAAGDGATVSTTVAVGSSIDFSEGADSGTSLADYTTTFSCNDPANTKGTGTSGSLIMPNADVTCTFTNVRTRTLTVVKSLVPSSDDGQFVMSANGTTGPAAGDGATASVTVAVGSSVNFSEVADSGTSLADYMTTFSCNDLANTTGAGTSGSLIMPNADVTCTFTNTRNPVATYTLSIAVSGTGSGAVTSAPAGIDCGTTCNAAFPQDEVVVLKAAPAANSLFGGWAGDADCSDGEVTMDGAKSCTATFVPSKISVYLPIVVQGQRTE
jgi:hypothetical protein